MAGITIGVLNDQEVAENLGKKGTTSDIQMYNYRVSAKDLTIAYPLRYPEKLQSLLYVLDLCDVPLVVVKEFSSILGEEIVALCGLNLPNGYVILENEYQKEAWNNITKGFPIANYEIVEKNYPLLFEKLATLEPKRKSESEYVAIDHFFNVKGVGVVVLGVARGRVRKHDKMRLYPLDKMVEIKSIQIHDVDVEEANNGDRVGLALKGIEVEMLERGQVLAAPGTFQVSTKIEIEGELVPYYKGNLENVTHLYLRLALNPCKVRGVEMHDKKFVAEVEMQKPFAINTAEPVLLIDLNARGLRIAGSASVRKIL